MENKFKLYEWYYVIVIVGYIMTLVSGSVHPGIIASLLMLLITGQLFLDKQFCVKGTIDYLMVLYFIYNLISGIWCISFGMPISVFLGEFATAALPMIFFYVGRSITEHLEGFYRKFIIAIFLVCIVGFALYIFAPEFYLNYLFHLHYISKADAPTMRIRMISVIGSILVGYLSVAAMLASAHIMINSKGKSGTLLLFINCFFAFMSNQRSAMVVAILVLLYVNLLLFFTFKMLPKKYFVIECGGILLSFAGVCIIYFPAIMKIYYRLISLPGAIGQRSDQWVGAVNNMANIWLGNGLGANGHRAQGFTDHFIADGGLAKLFCEMGILGTSIFIYMMILVFKKGSKKLVKCSAELGIIAITLLQCIGSNLLEFQLATPIFWFAVGRCASVIMEE
jgi:hypothetical protein